MHSVLYKPFNMDALLKIAAIIASARDIPEFLERSCRQSDRDTDRDDGKTRVNYCMETNFGFFIAKSFYKKIFCFCYSDR